MIDLEDLMFGFVVIFGLGIILGTVSFIAFGSGVPVIIGISVGIMCGALYALEKYS